MVKKGSRLPPEMEDDLVKESLTRNHERAIAMNAFSTMRLKDTAAYVNWLNGSEKLRRDYDHVEALIAGSRLDLRRAIIAARPKVKEDFERAGVFLSDEELLKATFYRVIRDNPSLGHIVRGEGCLHLADCDDYVAFFNKGERSAITRSRNEQVTRGLLGIRSVGGRPEPGAPLLYDSSERARVEEMFRKYEREHRK